MQPRKILEPRKSFAVTAHTQALKDNARKEDKKRRSSGSKKSGGSRKSIEFSEAVAVYESTSKVQPTDLSLFMVPHSDIWTNMVIATIMLHCKFVIFNCTYLSNNIDWPQYIHYSLEFCFAADTIFVTLHRVFSSHRHDVCNRKLPYILFLLSWISLIPVFEIYVYYLDGKYTPRLSKSFKLKTLLRLCNVLYYFSMKRRQAGANQLLVIMYYTFFMASFYVMAVSCIWRAIGSTTGKEHNWMECLKHFMYNEDSIWDQFTYPYIFIGSILSENYSGLIIPTTWSEYVIIICTCIFGIILKAGVTVAQLIRYFVNAQEKQHVFDSRLQNTFNFIETQNFDKDLNDDIKNFFNALWRKRKAITKMPPFFKLVPLSLQKEVMVDIFWDAFTHSHLFRQTNMTLKRDISLIMKSEYLMAGDFLYKTDEMKVKMVYVVSGIVQILSNEDDESPVISFSSGTVLSEASLSMLIKSGCMVRCATFCEFQTLSLTDFYRKILLYRNMTNDFRHAMAERLSWARQLYKLKHEMQQATLDRPFFRIKTLWRSIYKNKIPRNISNCHTARFLDLLVLSDEMELKVQVICMTASFPFIFHPDSGYIKFCHTLGLIAVFVQCVTIPYWAAFDRRVDRNIMPCLLFLDFINFFDVAMQATTAIKEKDSMITSFRSILMTKLRTFSFQADLVATIPVNYIGYLKTTSEHTVVLLMLPRIIKVYKIMASIRRYESTLGTNQILTKFIKYIVLFLICIYLGLCLLYTLACFDEQCSKWSWFEYDIVVSGNEDLAKISPVVRSLFIIIAMIASSGYADSRAYTLSDACIAFAISVLGYMMIILAMCEITAAQYWKIHDEHGHTILMKSMQSFGKVHKISTKLLFRVANMLGFRWAYHNDLIKWDAMLTFEGTPQNLSDRIRYNLITKYLEAVPVFQCLNESVIKQVANISVLTAVPPNSYLCFSERIITHIYVIKRGYCDTVSTVPGDFEKGTDKQTISAGACFPIVEVMHQINSFVTVRSITTVELIEIPYDKMLKYLKMDEAGYAILQESLKTHMRDNYSIIARTEHRLHLKVVNKTKTKQNLFQYSTTSGRQWQFTGDTFQGIMTTTVSPTGNFFITMEVIRCVLAIVQFVFVVLYINVLYRYRSTIMIINYILDVTVWIDCYIKTHVYYYDDDGKYELKRHRISMHYVHSSFWIDIYSSFPIYILHIDQLISTNHIKAVTCTLIIITRPVQLYRVFFGLSFLLNHYKIMSAANLMRLKCFLLSIVLLLIISNLIMIFSCSIERDEIRCSTDSWRGTSIKLINHENAIGIFIYASCQYFIRAESLIYTESRNATYCLYVFTSFLLFTISWYVLSLLTSAGLHSEAMTSQLQNDRMNFKAFAKRETAEENLVTTMLQTHEYLTRDVISYVLEKAKDRFTVQLCGDFSYTLYHSAMEKTFLLQHAPEALIRHLSYYMRSEFYKKDGIIIRNNDVQEQLYIIKKGLVTVTIADTEISSLSEGGMFGCFEKYGHTRQTINVEATLHTEVLCIQSKLMHHCIANHPKMVRIMNKFMHSNTEFVQSPVAYDTKSLFSEIQSDWQSIRGIKFIQRINDIIHQDSRTYEILDYVLNVHLSMLSNLLVFLNILYEMYVYEIHTGKYLMYSFDALFVVKIFLGTTLSYVDENSGLVIKDPMLILKRYLRTTFALDIVSLLPLELFASTFVVDPFYQMLFSSNRTLRVFFLVNYYNNFRRRNKLTHSLRCIFFIYIFIFCVQILTNLWSWAACYGIGCYRRASLVPNDRRYITSNLTMVSVLMCYQHVLNSVTSNSLFVTRPMDQKQIWLTTLIYLMAVFLLSMMYSGFAVIQVIDNYSLDTFNYNFTEIKSYLVYQKLSPAILQKVCTYYQTIWKVQNGEHLPEMALNAVNYLKEDLMFDVYNHHLLRNHIFRNTHTDFQRQVIAHFKRCTYPTNYVILEKGDIDKTMYFIHSGKVKCIERGSYNDIVVHHLEQNQSFGLEQGLIETCHHYTYVASTFVDIVMLYKDDWYYLLKFFPASLEEILTRARVYNLFNVEKL